MKVRGPRIERREDADELPRCGRDACGRGSEAVIDASPIEECERRDVPYLRRAEGRNKISRVGRAETHCGPTTTEDELTPRRADFCGQPDEQYRIPEAGRHANLRSDRC